LGVAVVFAQLLRVLPIQGLGAREAAFAYLIGQMGGTPESGFVLGAVSYLVLTAALATCGPLGWMVLSVRRND